PALPDARGGGEVIRRAIEAIGEAEVRVVDQTHAAEYLNHERKSGDEQKPRGFRRIAVEVSMQSVHGHGEEAASSPRNFVGFVTASDIGVAGSGEHVDDLFVKMPLGIERLSRGYFLDHSIHMDVTGKVEIQAAAADLRPRLDLLLGGIEKRISFEHRDFAFLQPRTIKIALYASTTAESLA